MESPGTLPSTSGKVPGDADSAIPGMRAHIEGCSACAEDHESLRAVVGERGELCCMADGDAARLFPGVPYSYSASTSGGTVFTAGACPLDADGKVVAEGDVAEQTQQTLTNLFGALSQVGRGPEDVVKTTIYVATTSQSDLTAAWDVVEEAFGSSDPRAPSSA